MENDKENFYHCLLYRWSNEINNMLLMPEYSGVSNRKTQLSFSKIEMCIKENPLILLNACTMHFYSALYGDKSDICKYMIFDKSDFDKIHKAVSCVFKKITCFISKTTDNEDIYIYKVQGINELGEKLLIKMEENKSIPKMWQDLYLSGKCPENEAEGVYAFKSNDKVYKEESKMLDSLLENPFFSSMDVSNLTVEEAEETPYIGKILDVNKNALFCFERHCGYCIKTLCW